VYNLKDGEYRLLGRGLLHYAHPEIDLNKEYRATTGQFMIVLSKRATRKIFGRQITVSYRDEKLYYAVEGYNTEFWFKVGGDNET
jgi:hypothetical protein